jgi:peptidoglycan/xylan/chitin deacetylase (PgdA/CDA1 family)
MFLFSKGIFTISIDFEFAWGYVDRVISRKQKEEIRKEVEISYKLIDLFEKHNIPATWAIVSHLLEKECTWENELSHPNFPRPIILNEKKDWFWQHSPKDKYDDCLWFDCNNLIEKIKNSSVEHEIGSHSYAHIIYGDKNTNSASVEEDLIQAKKIHKKNGLPFDTFIFPRNQVGHIEKLKKYGIKYFRGHRIHWYEKMLSPLNRLGHLADYYIPRKLSILPEEDKSGLIDISESIQLLSRKGLRKIVLPCAVKSKFRYGLVEAVKNKEIFHLWFHPSNLVYKTDTQFNILEYILKESDEMRREKSLDILTLNQIVK